MSRSLASLVRVPAAAFDFDVVTDVPARPPRKPEAAPARSDPVAPEPPKTEAPRTEAVESR